MQVHQGHPLLLLLQLLTIVPGQHSPLAGSQGPIYSPASSPTALMLGQPISSQTSIHPSKLYITQLVWPTHGKIPLIRLLEHMCGPLPSCSFTSSHLSSYLETSILRTNVLSFIHICQQVTSISIWRFFFLKQEKTDTLLSTYYTHSKFVQEDSFVFVSVIPASKFGDITWKMLASWYTRIWPPTHSLCNDILQLDTLQIP